MGRPLTTVIPSAPRIAISLPLTCDVSPPQAQVGVAPIAKKSVPTGGHAVAPAPRSSSVHQKFELLWQIISSMRREIHMRATPSPATDNGTPVLVVPNKSDFNSIPVHARRDGTVDLRGMAIGLPLTCDVSPPHAQVGVAPIAKKSVSTGGHAVTPALALSCESRSYPYSCKPMILLPDAYCVPTYLWRVRTSLQNACSGLEI